MKGIPANATIEVMTICPFCGEAYFTPVRNCDYEAWENGELAQNAFPYLSADERELIMTGICSTCWDKQFG